MAKRFIIDDATGALYDDFTARRVVTAGDVLEAEGGATETIELFLVDVNPQTRAVSEVSINTANVSLDIGALSISPTGGKVSFSYGGDTTAELPVASLSADSLAAALNRLDAIESDGGADVWPAGDHGEHKFYVRLQNTGAPGTAPTVDCDGITPPSAAEVTTVTAGASSERALWLIQIAEKPVASIAESAWSTVASGGFNGLTASLALNSAGLLAHLAKDSPPALTITAKNSDSVILRGTVPAFPAVDPTDLNGSALISVFPRIVTSTSNPTTGDDSGDGYAVGTMWLNTSTSAAWVLMDSTAGAASWAELTEVTGGYVTTGDLASYLALAGGTMTGALAMGTNKITGLGDATAAQDAVTKTQLDAKQATIDASARLDASLIGDNGDVSNTEYGYLDGVTSAIQTQLDAKATSSDLTSHTGSTGNPHSVTASDVSAVPLSGGVTISGTITMGDTLDLGSNYLYNGIWYSGQLSGDLNANSGKITSLGEATANGDAVRFEQLRTTVTTKTTGYTLTSSEARALVRMDSTSDLTLTVPASVFVAGDVITVMRANTGAVDVAAASGSVTINSVGSKKKLASRYSAATLICVTGGDLPAFDLIGDLTA